MNTIIHKAGWAVAGVLALLVAAALSGVIDAGPLDPPGAPAPTLKTLQEVEPRTPVQSLPGDTGVLHVISSPGSYYLTGNITGVSGKYGIIIEASNVTLDLNGFTLSGVAGSFDGILAASVVQNVHVKNGAVRGWGGAGVALANADNSRIEGIRSSNNTGGEGIVLMGGILSDCEAISNGGNGIRVVLAAAVSDCTSSGNTGHGFQIGQATALSGCAAKNNTLMASMPRTASRSLAA